MIKQRQSTTVKWLLLAAWCVLLTGLAYGRALSLPFFFDDFVHLPFVDASTLADMWRTAGDLAYFRPLPFSVWEIMAALFSRHDPVAQHAFNLVLHALNGLLVSWLVIKLWSPASTGSTGRATWARGFVSATLFILFPFSYQAVPWVGSLAQLLVTSLILLSLATYWQMRQTGRRTWGALSLVLAFFAPFAHESGALVGPLLAAILFTGADYRSALSRNIQHVTLWMVPALIWLPIWWLAPKAISGSVGIGNPETMLQNTAYFAQGVAYPLSWLGGRVKDATGLNDMLVSALLSGVALGGAALLLWFSRASRRSLLPWLWVLIASILPVFFLSFDYVINGPRLLMLASVGIAWLWSDVAQQAVRWIGPHAGQSLWPRRLKVSLVGIILLALVLQGFLFIQRRMDLHQLLGKVYHQAVALTNEANDSGLTAIIINLPAWTAPEQATYALGHEGVQFWPNYAPVENLVRVNSGRPADLALARNEAIRSPMPYYYGLSGGAADWPALARGNGIVYITEYESEQIALREAGAFKTPLPGDQALARFSDPEGNGQVQLNKATAQRTAAGLEIKLLWSVTVPPPDHITAFIHLVDEEGMLIAQGDGDPFAGTFPFSQWPAGATASDRRPLLAPGSGQTLLIGLYDRLTGERWHAVSASGQSLSDNALPIPVE